jgi:hypothetical protein
MLHKIYQKFIVLLKKRFQKSKAKIVAEIEFVNKEEN